MSFGLVIGIQCSESFGYLSRLEVEASVFGWFVDNCAEHIAVVVLGKEEAGCDLSLEVVALFERET